MTKNTLIKPDAEYEDWMNRKWRPFTAWSYIVICLFDFIVAPIVTFYFFGTDTTGYTQWQPITLIGSGLFHIAMGAILGVTAWQRGNEKIERERRYGGYYGRRPEEDRAGYRDRLFDDPGPDDRY